jgi:hypothetical protein
MGRLNATREQETSQVQEESLHKGRRGDYPPQSGASAPSAPGTDTFVASEGTSPGTLQALASSREVTVYARDGSGTMTVSPRTVAARSIGNTLTFTYAAGSGGLSGGEITLVVPSGWSAPSTAGHAGGYVTSTCGTVSLSGRTIVVTGVTLAGGDICSLVYGSRADSGPGATAPPVGIFYTFLNSEKSTSSGMLTALATSPEITLTR